MEIGKKGKKIKKQRNIHKEKKQKKIVLFQSVRTKMILVFLIPVLFIVILGYFSYQKSSQNIIRNYEKSSLTSLEMIADYYKLGFQSVTGKTSQFITNDTIKKYYSGTFAGENSLELEQYKIIQNILSSNAMNDSVVGNIYIFGDYGSGASTNGNLVIPKNLYSTFQESEEGIAFIESKSKFMWNGYHHYFDEAMKIKENDYGFSFTSYLYNANNRKVGIIVIDIKGEFLTSAMEQANFGEGSMVGFLTRDGREVLVGDMPKDFQFASTSFKMDITESGFEYVTYNGQPYLYLYTTVKDQDAKICALIPKTMITKQVNEVLVLTVGIVIAACIIAVTIGSIFALGISNTIKKMNLILHKTAAGDLTVRAKLNRKDEFAQLAVGINTMIDGMRELLQRTKQASSLVTDNSVEVKEHSSVLLKATQEISSAAEEIEHGANQQAEDSQDCLTQMSILADQIGAVSEKAINIDKISNQTREVIKDGIVIVDDLSAKALDTVGITQLVIGDIEKLEDKSKSVNDIIGTIHGLASQTNLLSLNASIEAARAGEAGKGFAVVAQEIRKLADQSKDAAMQISEIMEEIIHQTQETVSSAKKAEKIVETQEVTLNSTVQVFSQINLHVEQLSQNLKQILEGIQEMKVTKDDTLSAVSNISSTMQQTAAATGQLEASTTNQMNSVKGLHDAASQLKEVVSQLEEAINVFKCE